MLRKLKLPQLRTIWIQHMLNARFRYLISSFFHFSMNKKSNNTHFLQDFIYSKIFIFLEYLTFIFNHTEVEAIVAPRKNSDSKSRGGFEIIVIQGHQFLKYGTWEIYSTEWRNENLICMDRCRSDQAEILNIFASDTNLNVLKIFMLIENEQLSLCKFLSDLLFVVGYFPPNPILFIHSTMRKSNDTQAV